MRGGVGIGVAVAVVVVVLAAFTGVNVVDEPVHPAAWDPQVAELARFVQDERGMLFDRPVYVDFLTEEEFQAEVTTDDADLSAEDQAYIEDSTAELRALGLVGSDFDLMGETNAISGGATLAYYDPESERITVRGNELTPYVRGTLVHELTHALQDQHFDLAALQDSVGPDGDFRFRSVVEGDAVNVAQAYYEELSAADKEAYDDEEAAGDGGESDDEPAYAPVVAAFFGAPYIIGPSFVSLLYGVDGTSGVDDALEELPSSEAAILDASLYFDDVEPVTVDEPAAPEGTEVLDGGSFGALSWYVMLSSRVDAHDALGFIDEWRGDSYITYREDDRVCVAIRYEPAEGGLDDAQALVEEWADAMPSDAATVTRSDDLLEVRSCDPGDDADVESINDVSAAMVLPAVRLVIADQTLGQGLEFDQAWCYASAVVDLLTIEQLQSDSISPETAEQLSQAALACR